MTTHGGADRPSPTSQTADTPPAIARPEPSAWRSPRAWTVLLITIVLALAADLASKEIAFARIADAPVRIDRAEVLDAMPDRLDRLIPPHAPIVVVPNLLELKLVLNPGAVFGVGAGKRWFFVLFTVGAVAVGLWMFGAWTKARHTAAHLGLGLIIAGGLGNLYDRIVFASVRDFLHPFAGLSVGGRQLWPYVSNVADAFLLVGIALLLIHIWRSGDEHPGARPDTAAAK